MVPEEEKKKRYKTIFEEIVVENFPNMEKEIVKTPRHILIKLTKTKHKERILKATRKKQVTYKGNPICLTVDLSVETLQARRDGRIYLKY